MVRNSEQLRALVTWLEPLKYVDDALWLEPIAPGKWSIQGIVSHIMRWDEYFLNNAIEPIAKNATPAIEHLDFDEFNRNATEYGRTQTKVDLIHQTIVCRNKILDTMSNLSEEDYLRTYPGFALEDYVRDFAEHDEHHRQQVQAFLLDHTQ